MPRQIVHHTGIVCIRDVPIIGIDRLAAILPIIGIGRLVRWYRLIVFYTTGKYKFLFFYYQK